MRKTTIAYDWRLVQSYKIYLAMLAIGLVAGSIYAVTIRNEQEVWLVVNQYMMQSEWAKGFEVFKNAFWLHFKHLLVIGVSGMWRITYPLIFGVLLVVSFSYGFTVGGFVLLYGIQGVWVSIFLVGIQGSLLLGVYLYIAQCAQKHCEYEHQLGLKKYMSLLAGAMVVIVCVALMEAYVQPMFIWLIRYLM
ncbi:MAG: hypothetical protein ACRCTE_00950 [Cellulosilyticaceae bacterium]